MMDWPDVLNPREWTTVNRNKSARYEPERLGTEDVIRQSDYSGTSNLCPDLCPENS